VFCCHLCACNLQFCVRRKGGQIHPQNSLDRVLSFICAVVFYSSLSPFSFPPLSFRFWKNNWFLELVIVLGIALGWGSLSRPLQSFGLSSFWSAIDLQIRLSSKFVETLEIHFSRCMYNFISIEAHLDQFRIRKLNFELLKTKLDSNMVLDRFRLFGIWFVICLFC
jgi:hypothetical protein